MDLPITDPGSDLCDLTDSADEALTRTEASSARTRSKEGSVQAESKEKERVANDLVLPEITRPRSMSLGESFIAKKKETEANKRSHCVHLIRTFRHPSPVRMNNQDIQIKLSSLRQHIWMGVPLNVAGNIEKGIEHRFPKGPKGPLSWGVSNMALTRDTIDSDKLLKGCRKKFECLEYVNVDDNNRKERAKYKREAGSKDTGTEMENQRPDSERKSRKKKSRHKWQKMVNLNSKVEETCSRKASFLTIKTDSLKLVTLEIPKISKSQTRAHKIDSRRKHRKSGTACSMSNVAKSSNVVKSRIHVNSEPRSQVRLQPLIVPLCDSSSSEDSSDSSRQRVSKKKQKKKKQPKKVKSNPAVGKKMRGCSANE